MKKLDERSHWENEWADAFNDEKQTPSQRVWQNIDSVLANKEAKKYKKRAVFYKWLAAASVFISACGAVLFMLSSPQNNSGNNLAQETSVKGTQVQQAPGLQETGKSASEAGKGVTATGTETAPDHAALAKEADPPHKKDIPAQTDLAGNYVAAKEQKPFRETEVNASPSGKNSVGKETDEISVATVKGKENQKVPDVPEKESSGSVNSFAFSGEEEEKEEKYNGRTPASGLTSKSGNGKANAFAFQGNQHADSVTALVRAEKRGLLQEEKEPPFVEVYVNRVWVASQMLKNKAKESPDRFWIGAALASNSFKPNFVDNSPAPVLQAADNSKPSALTQRKSVVSKDSWDKSQESIISFAGGFQGAAHLSEKWVLQGGLQYGTYKTSGNAGAYSDAGGTHTYPLHYANLNQEAASPPSPNTEFARDFINHSSQYNSPVSAVNTFEFLSVPLTIGYIVLDKKIGLMLTPGITSEFFLSNQLSDEADKLGDYTVRGGESNSPYNVVHFRGLVGAQLFYKLGKNYVVSLEPSYQHAITDFNKSESIFDSRPSNISLGAAFRYIIR